MNPRVPRHRDPIFDAIFVQFAAKRIQTKSRAVEQHPRNDRCGNLLGSQFKNARQIPERIFGCSSLCIMRLQ